MSRTIISRIYFILLCITIRVTCIICSLIVWSSIAVTSSMLSRVRLIAALLLRGMEVSVNVWGDILFRLRVLNARCRVVYLLLDCWKNVNAVLLKSMIVLLPNAR